MIANIFCIIIWIQIHLHVVLCDFESCKNLPIDNKLTNVHILAFTHHELATVKTIDQFYYGTHRNIHYGNVEASLYSIINALLQDEKRRFLYGDIYYFSRWFKQRSYTMKSKIKSLVAEHRLQFVTGGLVQNDEATTHYNSILDQMTLGMDFIRQTFGSSALPKVAWQLDNLGHTLEYAQMLLEFGFDAIVIGKASSNYYERKKLRDYQFLQNTGYNTTIFIHTEEIRTLCLYDDIACKSSEMVKNKVDSKYKSHIYTNNVENILKKSLSELKTNHLTLSLGGDYAYFNAYETFKNIENLIQEFKTFYPTKYNLFYSTIECYIYALNSLNVEWPTNNIELLPYNYFPDTDEITGYFSTNSVLKRYIRYIESLLQIVKQLFTLTDINHRGDLKLLLKEASQNVALLQDHNAISGVHQPQISDMYNKLIDKSFSSSQYLISEIIKKIFANQISSNDFILREFCIMNKDTQCIFDEGQFEGTLNIIIYNPLIYSEEFYFQFTLNTTAIASYQLKFNNQTIDSQAIPNIIYSYNIYFKVSVPAFGFKSLTLVNTVYNSKLIALTFPEKMENKSVRYVENSLLQLKIVDGKLTSIRNLRDHITVSVTQTISIYSGKTTESIQNFVKYRKTDFLNEPEIEIINGPLVKEVRQHFAKNIHLVLRLFDKSDLIETEWIIDSHTQSNINLNYIVEFKTDLLNSNMFMTDSNARTFVKRHTKTPTKDYGENYYPMISSAMLTDSRKNNSIIFYTDRTLGCASQGTGQFEIMIFRYLPKDGIIFPDATEYGTSTEVSELMLNGRGKIWFTVGNTQRLLSKQKEQSLKLFKYPIMQFSRSKMLNYNHEIEDFNLDPLIKLSSQNITGLNILTLENHYNLDSDIFDYKLLRLENINLEKSIEINIWKCFRTFTIISIEEMNLSADRPLNEVNHLKWNKKEYRNEKSIQPIMKNSTIELKPGEIRTFKLTISSK